VAGALTVGTTSVLDLSASGLAVTGATSITGTINDSNVSGTNLFTGAVTVNSGGVWDLSSGNPAVELGGSLTNNQTFTAGSGVYTMSGTSKTITGTVAIPSLTVSGTVQNYGTLTVSTALAGSGTLTNGDTGTLNIGGTSGITGLTATAIGNTVDYSGTDQTIKNTTYDGLTVSGSMSTVTATATVQDVFLVSGMFAPNAGTLTLNNDLTNNGTFTASGTHTVVLATTAQADIAGSTGVSFQDFSVTGIGAAKIVKFKAGLTYNFAGTFTVTGADSQLVTITSDTGAGQWLADFAVAQPSSVTYADISYSGCSTSADVTLDATSTNSLNNGTCWVFPTTISVGGITASGHNDGATVKLALDGVEQGQTGTISANAFSITGVSPSADDIVTVWVDNVADYTDATHGESTAVTQWLTGDITGMVLDVNVLTIGSNQDTSVSLAELGLCDVDTGCVDEDIMHTSNAGTLLVEGSGNTYTGETLSVLASDTLTVADAEVVTTDKITNAGTITAAGSPTFNVAGTSGTLVTNSGTFTPATSTVDLTGNGSATINSGSPTFYNLTSSGTGTKSLGAGITIDTNGTLTVSAGTFDPATYLVTGSGTNVLAVSSGATLDVDAATFALNYSAGFATTTFDANSTTTYSLAGTQTVASDTYGHLTISGSGIKTLGGSTTVAGNLAISAGTLELSTTYNLAVTGTSSVTGTLSDTGAGGSHSFTGDVTVNSGGTWTDTGNASYTFGGNLTYSTGALGFTSGTGTHTFDSSTADQTVSGAIAFDIDVIVNSTTGGYDLIFSGQYPTVNTSLTQSANSVLTFSGTMPSVTGPSFSTSTNTVQYTGASQAIISTTYDDLTVNGSGTATIGGATVVNSTMTVSSPATNNSTLTVTIALTGTSTLTNGAAGTLNIGQATEPLASGTLTAVASGNTVNYTAAAPNCKVVSYHHLNFTSSGAVTCAVTTVGGDLGTSGTVSWTTTSNMAVTGGLTVGGTSSITTGAFSLTITGTTTVSGGTLTLNDNTGTKLLTGAVAVSSGTLDGASTGIQIENGITQSASGVVSITGTATFQTNVQALAGVNSIATVSVPTGITLTNDGTLTVSTSLEGLGGLTNSATGTLNIGFATAPAITTLDASTSGNTVNYTAAAPNCKVTSYHHLSFTGSGAVTCAVTTVGGDLTTSGTVTWSTNSSISVTGTLTINSSGAMTNNNTLTATTLLHGATPMTSRPLMHAATVPAT